MPLSIYGDNWAMDDLICVITKQPKPVIINEHKIRRDYNYLILHASGYVHIYQTEFSEAEVWN